MPDDLRKIFAKNLTKLLREKEITQLWIAEKMNVSSSTVSDWCKGNKAPRMDKIQRLAELLDVPVPFLTSSTVSEEELIDQDRLKALHDDPRLGMLFDHVRRMPSKDVDIMLQLAARIREENEQ